MGIPRWMERIHSEGHRDYSHSSHRQDDDDCSLFFATHLQRQHKKHWQDREDEIARTCNSRVPIGRCYDDRSIEAGALAASETRPEVLRWNTLEDKQEEEECAVNLGDDEGDPEDILVRSPDA